MTFDSTDGQRCDFHMRDAGLRRERCCVYGERPVCPICNQPPPARHVILLPESTPPPPGSGPEAR